MAHLDQADLTLLVQHVQTRSSLDKASRDNTLRERLIAICGGIVSALETPIEIARKAAFLGLDHAVVRSAIQLDIFALLASSEKPAQTTLELARETSPRCNVALLSRILRYLCNPMQMIAEVGPGLWQITSTGRIMAEPSFASACETYHDSVGPAFRELPKWITSQGINAHETGSQTGLKPNEQTSTSTTAFRLALPDEEGFFPWLHKEPARLRAFHTWMGVLAKYQYNAQDFVALSEWVDQDNGATGDVAFVDVGGGTGRACITLHEKRASGVHQRGRIILQDREEVVKDLQIDDVEVMPHDFFAEQPIRGARVYHFRQIFHDWPDSECIKILRHTRDAMVSQMSTILIDEVVLPEVGAHWMVTQRDLSMLALFNASERSATQWEALITQAGLQMVEIRCYDERMAASIIVVKRMD